MRRVLLYTAFLVAGSSRMAADLEPKPQVTLNKLTSSGWEFTWNGRKEVTYFSKWSADLLNWDYLPDITHGVGVKTSAFTSTSPKFFVRLFYTDVPTSNPELADFDLDGLGNRAELDIGTDPMGPDSDGDGKTDGVEVAGSGDPLSDSDGDPLRAADSDGDGLSDIAELARGTSPTLWDSDGDGVGDGSDAFPLDPLRHDSPFPTTADTTKPTILLDTPANAVFVSGP